MPFSSMNFTSEASLKRGGGCVSWESTRASRSSGVSPSAIGGRRTFDSSPSPSSSGAFWASVSDTWPYSRRKPGSRSTEPVARSTARSGASLRRASISTVVTSLTAGSSARPRSGSRSGGRA